MRRTGMCSAFRSSTVCQALLKTYMRMPTQRNGVSLFQQTWPGGVWPRRLQCGTDPASCVATDFEAGT